MSMIPNNWDVKILFLLFSTCFSKRKTGFFFFSINTDSESQHYEMLELEAKMKDAFSA